jgi:hypothetical protein
MTSQPITVHNAQLMTTTVEIKTLTVSGKQLTLAVFRQIQDEPFSGNRDAAWGRVNYCPNKACQSCDRRWRPGDQINSYRECYRVHHVHIVWQFDDELRRSTIFAGCGAHKRPNLDYDWAIQLPQLFIAV